MTSILVSIPIINNNPALVEITAWRQSGGKPLSESMMAQFTHRENMLTWLFLPRFQDTLHNFPTTVGRCHASLDLVAASMHFPAILLIMVIEIPFNFQICVQCAEQAISKITFDILRNLKQSWRSWHT